MVHSITPVLQVGIWSSSSNSYWEVQPASGETYAPTWQPAAWEYFTKSSVLVYHQDWAILPSLVVHWFKTLCFDCMSVGLIPGQRSSTCHVAKKYKMKIITELIHLTFKKKKINTNSQLSTIQSYSDFPNCPPKSFIVFFFPTFNHGSQVPLVDYYLSSLFFI